MFFNTKDVAQFVTQQQFIDTAVVPLLNMSFEQQKIQHNSSQAEYLMSLTAFVEQQFRGRVMLLPPVCYIEGEASLSIENWQNALQEAGFKHIFFVTCDHQWTSKQELFNIIWLPAIPLESMDNSMKQKILEDQLKLIIPNLTKEWTKQ